VPVDPATADRSDESPADLSPGRPGEGSGEAPVDVPAGGAEGDSPPADPPPVARRRGRPRDARAEEVILDAAVEVMAAQGPGGFTVDAVAARAGVGKATIYRRWPSRGALMLDTAHHRMGLEIDDVDTGSLVEDIVTALTPLGEKLRLTPAGKVLPVVMAEAQVKPAMREVLAHFAQDRRKLPRSIVERGIERGELPPDTDVGLLLDVLGGTIFFRVLLTDQPVDEPLVRQLAETVLAGFRAAPRGDPVPPA
jgi:AcrR family transcriptional regulator